MRRGTTPNLMLTVKGLKNLDLQEVWLTFKSKFGSVVKNINDMEIEDDIIRCRLTQDDTLALKGSNVDVQLRFLEVDGNAEATDIKKVCLHDILTDGKIVPSND